MFLRVSFMAFCLVITNAVPVVYGSNRTKLYLLGLFPLGGPYSQDQAIQPAAQLALQDINENPDILPDYEIVIIPRDSACDGGIAVNEMFSELYNHTTTKIMIIGAFCSVGTEPTAQASHHWNLIQISYASTSPKLSNRALFPRFFRLPPTDFVINAVRIALCREFKWKKVATIHQSASIFSLTMADFHRGAKKAGIEVIAAESFIDNPTTQIENIKNVGARIIVGAFYDNMARRVFCAVYHHKLYGAKYVWILPDWMQWHWWRDPDDAVDCTPEQMDTSTANYFGIIAESLPPDINQAPSLSGMSTSEFLERFKAISGNDDPETMTGFVEISFTYDSVWTAALALHEAERQLRLLSNDSSRTLKDFSYDSVTATTLFDIISNLTFQGISGPVKFLPSGDRVGLLLLRQLQDGERVNVGIMDPTVGSGEDIQWKGYTPIYWPGGTPPIDFLIELEDRQTIHPSLFVTGAISSTAGIALASCFLALNIRYRKLRVIKMSSPNMNNLILIGGMLAYVSIITQGVDTAIASSETFVRMCKARTWCLSIGFSLAFGSMFSKTWRVHKIFTNRTAVKVVLKDHRLFSFVATLVAIDVLILILRELINPLEATERFGATEVDEENDDIVYTPIRMLCESRNQTYWIGAFYITNGLLLMFGAFLAWETRKVSIPALNDSKFIGLCIYNILVLSLVGAPVSFVLEEQNTHYALVSILIWLATTITLCLVFFPKIRTKNDVQPAQSTIVSQTTQGQHGATSENENKEVQLLRQEIDRLKKSLKDLSGDDGGQGQSSTRP